MKNIHFLHIYNKNKAVRKIRLRKPKSYSQKKNFVERMADRMKKKMTWPEREFAKMMGELGIECLPQKIIGTKIFDFFLPEYNLIVEIDGDYFHCNPELFEEANRMQKRNMKNDKFKDVLAKGMGYKIERVWENELKNNYEGLKEQFRQKFGK